MLNSTTLTFWLLCEKKISILQCFKQCGKCVAFVSLLSENFEEGVQVMDVWGCIFKKNPCNVKYYIQILSRQPFSNALEGAAKVLNSC